MFRVLVMEGVMRQLLGKDRPHVDEAVQVRALGVGTGRD